MQRGQRQDAHRQKAVCTQIAKQRVCSGTAAGHVLLLLLAVSMSKLQRLVELQIKVLFLNCIILKREANLRGICALGRSLLGPLILCLAAERWGGV